MLRKKVQTFGLFFFDGLLLPLVRLELVPGLSVEMEPSKLYHGLKLGCGSSMQSTSGFVALTASMTLGCAWSSKTSLAQIIPASVVFLISVSWSARTKKIIKLNIWWTYLYMGRDWVHAHTKFDRSNILTFILKSNKIWH